ncbi:extracellular solute-binding protein [Paenibacillus sp. NPDC093718]|uniref:extracellular solute-binding protein n=1 Tax=Paenibacillus sp. NPDC093718 TaxID=3390601 RepID=UPI003D0113F8
MMKIARLKLLLSLVLASSLVISGCTSSSGTTGNKSAGGTDTGAKQETPPASDPKSSGERLALKWFIPSSADAVLPEGDVDFIGKAIEEKFDVDLTIENAPSGPDYDNKLNLLIASGEAPDLFVSTGANSQKYILDGVTADMTPYVTPEKMPNYFKWISEVELQRYAVEGKFERAPLIFPRNVYRSYYIRQDWLDHLGLSMPTNFEETMEVIRAFTFDDPDQNGKNDTYGLTAAGNGNTLSFDFPHWIQNGLIGAFMIRDNQLVDVQSDLAVQHVIQGIKDMMAEGTVDPDWFLLKGTEHEDKAVGGKAGIIVGGNMTFAFDSNPVSIQNKSKAVNPKANWMPFHPFADSGTWTHNLPESPFMFARKTAEESPEKLERMAQIIDWMSSEEGFLLINYGLEGTHYTRSGSTITVNQANVDALQKDVVEQGNFQLIYRFFYSNNPENDVLGLEVVDERMTERDREIIATIQSYKLQPSIGTNVAPPPGFNLADFRKKMKELQVQILFDEPDASNWPKYHEELMSEYGGQSMIDTYTEQIKAAGVIQ